MSNRYDWATEDIFSSDNEWESTFDSIKDSLDFSEFKGKLNNVDCFLECMKKQERLSRVFDKLSVYAMMKHDENTKNAFYDSLTNKITSLGAKFGANTAFVLPELTALDENVLLSYVKNPKLCD